MSDRRLSGAALMSGRGRRCCDTVSRNGATERCCRAEHFFCFAETDSREERWEGRIVGREAAPQFVML